MPTPIAVTCPRRSSTTWRAVAAPWPAFRCLSNDDVQFVSWNVVLAVRFQSARGGVTRLNIVSHLSGRIQMTGVVALTGYLSRRRLVLAFVEIQAKPPSYRDPISGSFLRLCSSACVRARCAAPRVHARFVRAPPAAPQAARRHAAARPQKGEHRRRGWSTTAAKVCC